MASAAPGLGLALLLAACGNSGAAPTDSTATDAASAAAPTAAASSAAAQATVDGDVDAKVPGTDYDATSQLPCGFDSKPPTQTCEVGVKRKWGEDGSSLVEFTKPDGRKRAIFVKGLEPYGADSAQADGSAGWDFATSRDGDRVTVKFGPETYVIVDALIEGG